MATPVESLLRDQLTERRVKLESAAGAVPGDEQVLRLLREVDAALARLYEGAGPVSGDYCDAVSGDGGSLYFAIGDVSGKGVTASMLMAHLHATLRALVPLNLPLDQLVTRASSLFCESALPSHFATLVLGRAGRSGDVEICNAGHVPPLVARGREVARIASTGIPIGMFCD